MRQVYFDHNATTPIVPEVRDAMLPFLSEGFGNPSSSHWAGRNIAGYIEEARERVARLIGAETAEIVFTSGGSEGDNMALRGMALKHGSGAHFITCTVEHPAVYSTCKLLAAYGIETTFVPVDSTSMVNPADIEKAIRPNTALISIMLANNETGTINPVAEIAAIARRHNILMHTDAVQCVGKIPVDIRELGVDVLTASGHKFNAPKGVGFQFIRKGVELPPLISGGHQERGVRAGTENVAGIVALGTACDIALKQMDERMRTVGALRERLQRGIFENVPATVLNGHPTQRVYNTLNVSFKYIEGEALLFMLNKAGIAVSTGSACSSGSSEPSRILVEMGLEPLCSRGAIRFSLGTGNTDQDVDYCLEVLVPAANHLLEMSPFYSK